MQLTGMTWNHPRGFDPLVAVDEAAAHEGLGISVVWDRRSLQDFEHYPLEDLAKRYDLIVMDHPHVGDAIASGAIIPIEDLLDANAMAPLRADVLPVVWNSYVAEGKTWALPIDAATQVTVWRPGDLKKGPGSWKDLIDLAAAGRVLVPLRSPHVLMSLFSLMANLGKPFPETGDIDRVAVQNGLAQLRALAIHLPDRCYMMDPIEVHESLASGGTYDCAALIYGYSFYGIEGVRPHRLRFAEMPGPKGPAGTMLGGTGLAISRFGRDPAAAARYAARVAGAAWQVGVIAPAGGQPSSITAQTDLAGDARVNGFWRDTARTLEGAWVRPRTAGYVKLQEAGSQLVAACLRGEAGLEETVTALIAAFRPKATEAQ